MSDASATPNIYLARGSRDYLKANFALFAASFATFSSMYSVQPLMPLFSRRFDVSAAVSSLSLSVTTGVLAFTLFLAGLMSGAIDRKRVMAVSLFASALLSLLAAAAPSWSMLLMARGLEGFTLGGVPALAMAYLSEEIEPAGLGSAVGLYIAGSATGGMGGRVIAGWVAEAYGWRAAIAAVGAIGLIAGVVFVCLLPRSKNFVARKGLSLREHAEPVRSHLRHPALPWVFFCGFAFMGAFVSVYNYSAYRLAAPPFSLGQGAIGAVFTIYILGIFTSAIAGRVADRHGRPPVLVLSVVLMAAGLAITWIDSLPAIVLGIGLVTIGFFAGHSTASGWVGLLASHGKGHAAGLYLLGYYLGSSILGSLGGLFWADYAWPGVAAMVAIILLGALAAILGLYRWHRQADSA
ncbi:MFS transporter [Salinisphaera sp. Q1T1-3]|uniref:MFS transporter n=1 Tax=Salinisphaera sp. Q1T1-3 TaxID=2321229 RepID=UPI000E76FCEA|nr:MFS transporter [Salinisphaera sp. Q1T1-3]RJS95065.1 MFS transporter [Salinisphaera sp. Q1T1-3]